MADLYLKKVEIENYRCFAQQAIALGCPDGINPGSGLNILIGENGNGKTTILEAINLLSQSSYAVENKLAIGDFQVKDNSIVVKGFTNDFQCKMPYAGNYFDCNGIEVSAKNRDRKSPGRLLSSPFQVSASFINKTVNYKNSKGVDSTKPIEGLHKLFRNENIIAGEFSIFFFDKNRSRQISTGTFTTTFERICEDLNWRFAKSLDTANTAAMVKNISGDYFTAVLDSAQKGIGTKLAADLCTFFGTTEYNNLKIDLLDLLHPFSQSFFAIRDDSELKQIKTKALGSGIEMILTILLLKSVAGASKGSIIYLIDEPELHLHPKAQDKFLSLLLDESKDKQIIVSTHSPYIFKNAISGPSKMIILKRDAANKVALEYPNTAGWGKFPWSPSWGEINYHAFDLPTVEFHNELFGYIQERNLIPSIVGVDAHLAANGVAQTKNWIRLDHGVAQPAQPATLPYYVRNSIHHPENQYNVRYTDTELKDSIALMLPLA